jgi:hypothetical protein
MRGFGFVDRPPSHEKDAQGVTKDDCIALKEMEVSVRRKQQSGLCHKSKAEGIGQKTVRNRLRWKGHASPVMRKPECWGVLRQATWAVAQVSGMVEKDSH